MIGRCELMTLVAAGDGDEERTLLRLIKTAAGDVSLKSMLGGAQKQEAERRGYGAGATAAARHEPAPAPGAWLLLLPGRVVTARVRSR
ncbi:hypothetical protein ACIBBG_33335 [Micromonospora chersina]|uniref:hypothetical protein n=1 Tax=Micromonospora chersina TaxID=47854 RepID=UPI0037B9F20E